MIIGYIPYKVCTWDRLQALIPATGEEFPLLFAEDGTGELVGFIPVYRTVEALRKDFPTEDIVGVKELIKE